VSVYRYDGTVQNAVGTALPGVSVAVLTQPANTSTQPGTPLASIFTDSTGATPLANPLTTDNLGNYFFYAAPGTYTIQIYGAQLLEEQDFPDQEVVAPGGGSVTSVALTMPAEFSVAGSPVTSSGTFAVTKANQNANLVYAGPSSGGAAAPTFRTLTTADFPGGTGTVSSVALSVPVPAALLSSAITGSPVTSSGTLTATITLANQSANQVFAGATSGGAAQPSFRALVAADLPGTLLTSAIVPLTSANILALDGTPITLVAAQGVGFTIVPLSIIVTFTGGSAAYTDAGGAVSFAVGSLSQALSSNAIFLVTTSPNKNVQALNFAATATAGNPPSCDNAPLTITKVTNNFAAGNGTASIQVLYVVLPT
jgi:hypothetical protein